jgi:hypothetical protein
MKHQILCGERTQLPYYGWLVSREFWLDRQRHAYRIALNRWLTPLSEDNRMRIPWNQCRA